MPGKINSALAAFEKNIETNRKFGGATSKSFLNNVAAKPKIGALATKPKALISSRRATSCAAGEGHIDDQHEPRKQRSHSFREVEKESTDSQSGVHKEAAQPRQLETGNSESHPPKERSHSFRDAGNETSQSVHEPQPSELRHHARESKNSQPESTVKSATETGSSSQPSSILRKKEAKPTVVSEQNEEDSKSSNPRSSSGGTATISSGKETPFQQSSILRAKEEKEATSKQVPESEKSTPASSAKETVGKDTAPQPSSILRKKEERPSTASSILRNKKETGGFSGTENASSAAGCPDPPRGRGRAEDRENTSSNRSSRRSRSKAGTRSRSVGPRSSNRGDEQPQKKTTTKKIVKAAPRNKVRSKSVGAGIRNRNRAPECPANASPVDAVTDMLMEQMKLSQRLMGDIGNSLASSHSRLGRNQQLHDCNDHSSFHCDETLSSIATYDFNGSSVAFPSESHDSSETGQVKEQRQPMPMSRRLRLDSDEESDDSSDSDSSNDSSSVEDATNRQRKSEGDNGKSLAPAASTVNPKTKTPLSHKDRNTDGATAQETPPSPTKVDARKPRDETFDTGYEEQKRLALVRERSRGKIINTGAKKSSFSDRLKAFQKEQS